MDNYPYLVYYFLSSYQTLNLMNPYFKMDFSLIFN